MIKIAPQSDHIIILRRTSRQCKYNTSYLTHRRRLTIPEMQELAKAVDEKKQFEPLEAYFKLYNSNQGTVFYFMNPSQTQTVTAEFNLTFVNLALQGAKEGATSFRVVLAPESEAFRALLPIERNLNTSIKMGFSFSAEE